MIKNTPSRPRRVRMRIEVQPDGMAYLTDHVGIYATWPNVQQARQDCPTVPVVFLDDQEG